MATTTTIPTTAIDPGVTPALPYTQADINDATSQTYANAFQQANLPYLLKQTYSPGTGLDMSASNMQLAMPMQAGILSNAISQAAGQQTSDAAANANALLGGQNLQSQTALELANLQSQGAQSGFNQAINQGQFNNQLLSTLFGGGGGSSLLGSLFGGL